MNAAYLDNAATTAMLPEALEVMLSEASQVGNASSLHGAGRRARRVVEESREKNCSCSWRQAARDYFYCLGN